VPTFEASPASPTEVQADLLMLPVFEGRVPGPGVDAVGRAMGSDLMELLKAHGGRGRLGDTFVFPSLGRIRAGSVMLVGLGPRDKTGPAEVRRATMKAARTSGKFATVASTLSQVGRNKQEAAQAFAEGLSLGAYRFDRYKHQPMDEASKEKPRLKRVVALANGTDQALRSGLARGEIYGDASNWARDMVNTPAIDATPSYLADQAKSMAKDLGLTVKVWSKGELTRGGFGGILGVGAGSANEPRLIELTYRGGGARSGPPIAITGKGVTFDSGGLSIKPADAMEWMKADMGGAAAALAAMRAVAQLKPKVDVIAAIPSAENLPGGSAIRPGDVLHHRGGKTSEVLNTDAEGRLILADALAYLSEKKPRVIIDSATLTGAAMIALGIDVWAVMGTDRKLIADLLAAGQAEGEPGWELPLWTDYRRHIESTVADVKNVGIRWGGAITAGLFLKEFVGDVPWAHLDVAGTAFVEQGGEYWPRGATGSPARTIVRYIEDQAAAKPAKRATARRATARRGR
jgi:leucyl aminopeptidase